MDQESKQVVSDVKEFTYLLIVIIMGTSLLIAGLAKTGKLKGWLITGAIIIIFHAAQVVTLWDKEESHAERKEGL